MYITAQGRELFFIFKFWYRVSARGSAHKVGVLCLFLFLWESISPSRHRQECFRTSVHNGFSIPQISRGISLSLSLEQDFFLSLERLFSVSQGFSFQNNNLWGRLFAQCKGVNKRICKKKNQFWIFHLLGLMVPRSSTQLSLIFDSYRTNWAEFLIFMQTHNNNRHKINFFFNFAFVSSFLSATKKGLSFIFVNLFFFSFQILGSPQWNCRWRQKCVGGFEEFLKINKDTH